MKQHNRKTNLDGNDMDWSDGRTEPELNTDHES